MQDDVIKVKNEIESFLKEDIEHQNKKIDLILINPNTNETITIASDGVEEMIMFAPYTKEQENGYMNVPEWDFNYDGYVFEELEKDYQVGFMCYDMHYGIWNTLNELYPEEIDNKNGVQVYLKYCKDNNITKEYLDNKLNLDTPDTMKYYDSLEIGSILEYKGYVIEIDDYNYDNNMENIVQIYESKQGYIDGENIERISLNTIGLKQNIKDYIDDVYFNIDENKDMQSEKAYFTFVLGYDLLNDMLSKSSTPDNDVSYDFCNMVAENFLKSEEYKNEKHSAYEMLENWLEKNKEKIITDYKEFIGENQNKSKTRQLDNVYVIDVGYRKNQPVALVKRNEEYVIAFNYRIKDNKMDWAYGYYYDNNLNKAKSDFNNVLSGGNLANTFKQREER